MKAIRANLLGEFTGKLDGLIYYRDKKTGKLLVRRQWECPNHPAYPSFRRIQKALKDLQPSEAFRQDLRLYAYLYNDLPISKGKATITWNNIYIKMMYAMQSAMPQQVNLETISRQQIEEQNLPCQTVAMAIEAGLLPAVRDYHRFSAML